MRKKFLAVLALWVAVISLVACGGGDPEVRATAQSTQAQGSDSPAMVKALGASVADATPSDLVNQAVNLQDAIAILKMIVGLDVNAGGQPVTPYQLFAADFDGNGKVELADAIGVLKRVVGLDSTSPKWLFFNTASSASVVTDKLNPGRPPELSADIVDSAAAQVGLVAVLRGDVVGSALNYSWSLGTKPTGSNAVLASATAATPTFTADRAGDYVATLRVTDGGSNSASTTLTLTAGAPKLIAPRLSMNINAALSWPQFTNGNPLRVGQDVHSYIVSPAGQVSEDFIINLGGAINNYNGYSISPNLPAGLSMEGNGGRFSGTVTQAQPQTNYALTATGPGGTSTVNFTLTVLDTQQYSAYTKKYLDGIGFNLPKLNPVHYYAFSDNIPADLIRDHKEVFDLLKKDMGGYDRFVHLIYELNGNNDQIISTANTIGFLTKDNKKITSINDIHNIRSCLSGFSAFGKSDGMNEWSICMGPNPLTDPVWADDRKNNSPNIFLYRTLSGFVHEYFHHYQRSQISPRAVAMPDDCCGIFNPVGAPAWWVEGAAMIYPSLWMKERFKELTFSKEIGAENTDQLLKVGDSEWIYASSKNIFANPSKSRCSNGNPDVGSADEYRDTGGCGDWYLMNTYLAYLTSYQTLWVNMPRDMFELGFDGAFKKHVGMTKEEFYKKYNDFMREGKSTDLPPPGFFPTKPVSQLVDFWAKR